VFYGLHSELPFFLERSVLGSHSARGFIGRQGKSLVNIRLSVRGVIGAMGRVVEILHYLTFYKAEVATKNIINMA
jgi:hypothetical protein